MGDSVFSVADSLESVAYTGDIFIIIDRLVVKASEDEKHQFETRLKDSISLAFLKSEGSLRIYFLESGDKKDFYQHAGCPICGFMQEDLTISHFSFNSHHGACESCHGIGSFTTFLEADIINPKLSLAEGAILPWSAHPYYTAVLEVVCEHERIDINMPYSGLTEKERKKILYGVPGSFEIPYI